ncbi:MAG: alpha/beta fold hydrolase [Albidovulum sp.]
MPLVTINGAQLHYTDEGAGAETIVFAHGLLFSSQMFAAQIAALKDEYRCIAYDHRGQGQSEVTLSGYDMDSLTDDAAGLIEELRLGPCHFVGLSMGGFLGMRLGLRRPDLLRSLTLIDTTADPEPAQNQTRYRMLNLIARWFGLGVVVGQVLPIVFGQTFLNDPERASERKLWRRRIAGSHRLGITRAVTGVIERQGVAETIAAIRLPTLILVGAEDVATPPEQSKRIAAAISGSTMETIAGAGHSAAIEQPAAVSTAIATFVGAVPGAGGSVPSVPVG